MSEENAGASGSGAPESPEKPQETGALAARGPLRFGFLGWFAVLVAALSLFVPLSASGIWDPPEREVAELARRIALNLLGGEGLSVPGADNEVPTRSELGRGELPFTSIAVGFRTFGLHEWAGRLPLAIWGALGLAATFWLVLRLSDRRGAWFSVLVLSTTPLYFLHARTMLGDIVTMAGLSLAVAGLGLAVFERGEGEARAHRVLALGLGILGMLCTVLSRGVLLGIFVPAFSVGATWLFLRVARVTSGERVGDAFGAGCLGVGLCAGFAACRALFLAGESAGAFSWLLGSAVNRPHVQPTFDSALVQLGHALFPFSAVLPVALGTLLRVPPVLEPTLRERESALRVLVLALTGAAMLAHGVAAPVVGSLPFPAASALAIAVALFMRDFERGAQFSRASALVPCAFAILLLMDFRNFPEKALSAFGVSEPHFPDSFKLTGDRVLGAGTLIFCAAFFFLLQERSTSRDARFEAQAYRAWPRALSELWAGNLQFALLVLEAALIGWCALGFLSDRLPGIRQIDALGSAPRAAAFWGACAVPLVIVVPPALTLVRDAFRTLFDPELGSLVFRAAVPRWLPGGFSRAHAALLVAVGFGLSLSLGYYPLLAAQISPKQVFDAYARKARPGEALGTLGPGVSSATYYAGSKVMSFDTAARAFEWLTEANARRWLVIRESDLGTLNFLYRAAQSKASNLPVIDAGSSELLLVSNQLGGARNDNPLGRYLPEQPPHPEHVVSANLGGQLEVLGWDTLDLNERTVPAIEAGRRYTFVIYYLVVQPISGNWETFVHIDGFQRRFNGDHPTLGGKYPFALWHVGDWVADRSELTLEPNFGAGKYRVYFGLYNGNRRLEVHSGPATENRIEAGFLEVL